LDLELEEVFRALAVEGYDAAFSFGDRGVSCAACSAALPLAWCEVDGATAVRDTATARANWSSSP
jgi:hypothetical protein